MSTLSKLFGKSPFGPLENHMAVVKECVDLVIPFFEANISNDTAKSQEIAHRILELEEQADTIKNTLRDNLPLSLFIPVNRTIMLEILDYQDSIADAAKDISQLFTLRSIPIPEQIVDDLRAFVDSSVKVCHMAASISARFEELVDASFLGAEAERVLGMITELNNLERENDIAGLALSRRIFTLEKDLSPVDIFIWFKLNSLIGELANYAQKMGNRMRLLLAK